MTGGSEDRKASSAAAAADNRVRSKKRIRYPEPRSSGWFRYHHTALHAQRSVSACNRATGINETAIREIISVPPRQQTEAMEMPLPNPRNQIKGKQVHFPDGKQPSRKIRTRNQKTDRKDAAKISVLSH